MKHLPGPTQSPPNNPALQVEHAGGSVHGKFKQLRLLVRLRT